MRIVRHQRPPAARRRRGVDRTKRRARGAAVARPQPAHRRVAAVSDADPVRDQVAGPRGARVGSSCRSSMFGRSRVERARDLLGVERHVSGTRAGGGRHEHSGQRAAARDHLAGGDAVLGGLVEAERAPGHAGYAGGHQRGVDALEPRRRRRRAVDGGHPGHAPGQRDRCIGGDVGGHRAPELEWVCGVDPVGVRWAGLRRLSPRPPSRYARTTGR